MNSTLRGVIILHAFRISFLFAFFFASTASSQQRLRVDTVPAPSLRDNMLGDSAWREAAIYLPLSYAIDPQRRYPVVYLLHGFGGGYEPFVKRVDFEKPLDSLAARGLLKEMIIVVPDANNRHTGAFIRNSPVTGNWEDFVVTDLVTFIDTHYRTIRSRRSRGIAGWSMGGYGALYVAARHPELFSAVYALSPCCLTAALPSESLWRRRGREGLKARESGLSSANFNANIVIALAAIYSPSVENPPLRVRLPWQGDSATVVDSIASLWRDTPLEMVRAMPSSRLRAVRWAFDAGDRDAFPDIPLSVTELHRVLSAKGVAHTYEIFRGTHGDRIRERVETRLLPFFSRAFKR